MNRFRRPAAVAVAALALAALPTTAVAHDGDHPFQNCTEAYDNGYSNIPVGDEHYAERLDRDKDGIGCDQPPADFVPVDDTNTGDEDAGAGADESNGTDDTSPDTAGDQGTDLAATGGSSATPYLAGGGAAVLLAGGGVLLAARKRRTTR